MEELQKFPFLISFIAGLFSFISPCILPLIPAFISFITGTELEDLQRGQSCGQNTLKNTFLKTAVFILGFSFVFIMLGMSASWLGAVLLQNRAIFRIIGGIIVIIFGLHMTGIFKIGILNRQISLKQKENTTLNWVGIFFVGFAFAFGWTPCIGPVLASILVIASTQGSVFFGFLMLLFYSLGLAIPFMLTALFINRFLALFKKIKKYYKIIEIVIGILLVITGILLLTDSFTAITFYILQ